MLVAILPADQSLGKIKHSFRVIQALDIDLFPKAVAAFIVCAQPLILLGRHIVVPIQVHIASKPKVFHANEFLYMVEMVQDMINCCRFFSAHKHSHSSDPHYTTASRHLLDCLISLK